MKTDPREQSNTVDMCYDHMVSFCHLSFNSRVHTWPSPTQRLLLLLHNASFYSCTTPPSTPAQRLLLLLHFSSTSSLVSVLFCLLCPWPPRDDSATRSSPCLSGEPIKPLLPSIIECVSCCVCVCVSVSLLM